jgi:GxxExxY protein
VKSEHRGSEKQRLTEEEFNELTKKVIGAAIEVHRELGPGLLESVYEYCLAKELRLRGIGFEEQVQLPVHYKGEILEKEFFVDMIVEDELILELKAIEQIAPVHEAQLLSYLRLASKRLGLLINFNVPVLKDGIRRIINGRLTISV